MRKLLFTIGLFLALGTGLAGNKEKASALYEQAQNKLFENEESIDKATVNSAIQLYKQALEEDSEFAPAYEQLAIEYWSLGETQAAFDIIEKGLEQVPSDAAMFALLRGIFFEDQKKMNEANESYRVAVKHFDELVKTNKSFDTIFFRSLAYYLTQNVDVAIQKYKEAVEKGYYNQEDYDEFYDMQLEVLENMDLTEFLEYSITNKYHFK